MNLRDQFLRPTGQQELLRIDTRRRRIALAIARGIALAHVKAHGTETEVPLMHQRPKRQRIVITVEIEDLFS